VAVEARAVRVAVARREMLALEPGDDAAGATTNGPTEITPNPNPTIS